MVALGAASIYLRCQHRQTDIDGWLKCGQKRASHEIFPRSWLPARIAAAAALDSMEASIYTLHIKYHFDEALTTMYATHAAISISAAADFDLVGHFRDDIEDLLAGHTSKYITAVRHAAGSFNLILAHVGHAISLR